MKGITHYLMAGSLILASTLGFANTNSKTSMDSNWVCSTNASSSNVETDKSADNEMSNTAKSAADAFSFAAKNCRDCTEINCEVKS
ncbi:hypothetical protein Lrub_2414 [Legionella rubrilucens]|uniref:Uncharacterized protein n=1 Tax=Legionella rubrilucens TaxID=458 RepID=A0A0W0XLN2_9GAMM|nr:hypothetical protein [Legionella rubrilucens]KTD45617.1 hypothetical protein Lrub_2414 [Legionella rubrilucens]